MQRVLPAAVTVLALAACAHGGGAAAFDWAPQLDRRPVRVDVTNNYGLPADIFAIGCGTSYRIGTVYPGLVSHFVLRQGMLACGGMVEFVAKPAGTEPLVRAGQEQLAPGDIVDFEITTHLIASYTAVHPGP